MPMKNWEMSPTEPAEPADGDIWINTAVQSRIKIRMVKRKNIFTTPCSAAQYASGKWNAKPMRIHRNESWEEQRTALFEKGVDNPSIGSWIPWGGSSFTKNKTTISMYCHWSVAGGFQTTKAINVAGFKRLWFWCTSAGGHSNTLNIYNNQGTLKTVNVYGGQWNKVDLNINDSVYFKFNTAGWQTSGVHIGIADHDGLPAIYLE